MIGRMIDIRTLFLFLLMIKGATDKDIPYKLSFKFLSEKDMNLPKAGPQLPPKEIRDCSYCSFPVAAIIPTIKPSSDPTAMAKAIEDTVMHGMVISTVITSGYYLIKKLGSRTGNPKKKNKKYLVSHSESSSESKSPSESKMKGKKVREETFFYSPLTISNTLGKVPKGKMSGLKKYTVGMGRMTNAAMRKALRDAKHQEEIKKIEEESKRKIASQEYTTKRSESKESKLPIQIHFKEKVTPADYKKFALENALQLSNLQEVKEDKKESKEANNRRQFINYLAGMYYLLRTTLNLMEHQANTLGRDLKNLKIIRNIFVHKIMDMNAEEFTSNLSSILRKSLPEQFRLLKDKGGELAYTRLEVDRIDRAFGMTGPTYERVASVAHEFKIPLSKVPKLSETAIVDELNGDKLTPIHLERFKISDFRFFDWLNQKILPILNWIAEPLVTADVDLKHHALEIAALKQLLTFIGEFYHSRRFTSDMNLSALLKECRLIRNKVDHAIYVDKKEWLHTLHHHEGPKRIELDVRDQEVLDLCHKFKNYNPRMTDSIFLNGAFSFSLTSHTMTTTSSSSYVEPVEDYPNLAKFFSLKPLSELNPKAESFVPASDRISPR